MSGRRTCKGPEWCYGDRRDRERALALGQSMDLYTRCNDLGLVKVSSYCGDDDVAAILRRSLRFERHLHWKHRRRQTPTIAAGSSFVRLKIPAQEFPEPRKRCLLILEAG
ncbi:hypothetical protein C0J52_07914 [Blattella germanica]|nr:hypothetical protein C0J52_07914 [Blattella germanica]